MNRNRIARVIKIALIGTLAIGLFGFVVMSLWNWLMPALFGLRLIGFWQALGLLVLSKILFGGFHHHEGRDMHWRRRMLERWDQMTPEERERFRSDIRGGCGFAGPSPANPGAPSETA
jgi:hypothetical protein